jgi:hypothetical protein
MRVRYAVSALNERADLYRRVGRCLASMVGERAPRKEQRPIPRVVSNFHATSHAGFNDQTRS